jgi:TolB protein
MKLLRVTCCLFVLLLSLVAFAFVAVHPALATFPGPNGRITFDRFNPAIGDDQLFAANPDGSHEIQLTTVPSETSDWSPDGTRIAFNFFDGQTVQISTMNPDGTGVVQLTHEENFFHGEPAWSPDGARLAFEFGNPSGTLSGIDLMDASTGQILSQITTNPFGGSDGFPRWEPSGKQLVFRRENPPLHGYDALFIVNADGSGLRQLTPWGLASGLADWSPDGTKIVFAGAENRPKGPLWVINHDGTGLREIFQDTQGGVAFDPVWSPDGTKILFARNPAPRQGGQEDLYTINPDGTGLTQVTNTPDREEFPDWGPYQG